jgi:hypothetical protein
MTRLGRDKEGDAACQGKTQDDLSAGDVELFGH